MIRRPMASPAIYARAFGMVRRGRTPHEAEELVRKAWVKMERYGRDQPVNQSEAFLMRTALNLSVDAHRMGVTHARRSRWKMPC